MATLTAPPPALGNDGTLGYEGLERYNECWDGEIVVPPMANDEHTRLQMQLGAIFSGLIDWDAGESCHPGANISDRAIGWLHNFRIPDVLVYLRGNPARDCGTHWVGGPDFLVEIMSDDEDPLAKLDFYASIGTREVLIVQRDPWALELFRLKDGTLASTGRCEVGSNATLISESLGLTFALHDGPKIAIEHPTNRSKWIISP